MVDDGNAAASAGEWVAADAGHAADAVQAPDEGAVVAAEPAEATGDPWARFDRWAGWLFVAMALLTALGSLLVLGIAPSLPGAAGVLLFAVALVQAALFYWVGVALGRRWGWARTAALWILGIAAVQGVGSALLDLSRSRLTIPVGAILAILVIFAAPGRPPTMSPADRRWARAAIATTLAFAILPIVASLLLLEQA